MGPPLIIILILGNSSHHGYELKMLKSGGVMRKSGYQHRQNKVKMGVDSAKKVRYNGVATHPSAHYYERRQSCETHTRKIMIP